MSNRIIPAVKDNSEKQETYRTQLGRYHKAIKNGFYFEAMLIDYAMLEDRMRSFLYHASFFADRLKSTVWNKTKPFFAKTVSEYKDDKETDSLGVTNITGKIKVIRCLLRWVAETDGGYQDDKYMSALKSTCEGLDIKLLMDALDEIEQWCKYRNEIVHALLNKRKTDVYLNIRNKAEEGMDLARTIDSQVKILKKGNVIRKSINAVMR